MAIQTGLMERRVFERVVASVRVTYRLVPKKELKALLADPSYRDTTLERLPEMAKKSNVIHAMTRDLSVGGMALSGSKDFPSGDAVAVFLYLPDAPTPVTVVAEVVHSEPAGGMGGNAFRAGLKILAINREDVVRLEKYLLAQKLKDGEGNSKGHKG
jgi:Tfp pilus assembly protein PilZ